MDVARSAPQVALFHADVLLTHNVGFKKNQNIHWYINPDPDPLSIYPSVKHALVFFIKRVMSETGMPGAIGITRTTICLAV